MLYSVWSELPTEGIPYSIIHRLVATQFHKKLVMYWYSICLVSTMCCGATITEHKRNTNIHKLRTLLNPVLQWYNLYTAHWPQITFDCGFKYIHCIVDTMMNSSYHHQLPCR